MSASFCIKMANVIFIEEQKFRHNLIWSGILLLPLCAILCTLTYQVANNHLIGDHPMSNRSLLVLSIIYGVPVIFIIYYVRLTTIISDENICFGWNLPTNDLNEIKLEEIKSCSVIEYNFVGWGYRLTRKYGTVYNVDGNKGLQIVKHSGAKVLIGTHHAVDLKNIIESRLLAFEQNSETS